MALYDPSEGHQKVNCCVNRSKDLSVVKKLQKKSTKKSVTIHGIRNENAVETIRSHYFYWNTNGDRSIRNSNTWSINEFFTPN